MRCLFYYVPKGPCVVTDREQIVANITARLYEVIPDARQLGLTAEQDLRDFPAFDSLGVLETLVWLESTFAITIPDEELIVDRFDSVDKMADYVIAHCP
jgi:acyl carrier protein